MARSSSFLLVLGGGTFVVALVVGLGEFLRYGVRIISGYFADPRRNCWASTIAGYFMIGAIPRLALAGGWETTARLLIL